MCRDGNRPQRADVEKLRSAELIAAERKKKHATTGGPATTHLEYLAGSHGKLKRRTIRQ